MAGKWKGKGKGGEAAAPPRDHRAEARDKVVAVIEDALGSGKAPDWTKSWAGGGPPMNAASKKGYRGINKLILGLLNPAKDGDNRWLTFNQAKDLAGERTLADGSVEKAPCSVKKGSKGLPVFFWQQVEKRESQFGPAPGGEGRLKGERDTFMICKVSHVFHASQIENMPPIKADKRLREGDWTMGEDLQAILDGARKDGVAILEGGAQPSYEAKTDTVRIPHGKTFFSEAAEANALIHELCHAAASDERTGVAEEIRKRFGGGARTETSYGMEELAVELATAQVAASLDLPQQEAITKDAAAYMQAWIGTLKEDVGAIAKIATLSDRLSNHVLGLHEGYRLAHPEQFVQEPVATLAEDGSAVLPAPGMEPTPPAESNGPTATLPIEAGPRPKESDGAEPANPAPALPWAGLTAASLRNDEDARAPNAASALRVAKDGAEPERARVRL